MELDIAVNTKSQPRAKDSAQFKKFSARRAILSQAPVKKVQATWHEEQAIYDRMYESEVWKNGHFFGYRSTTNQRWHDDEESTRIANAEKLDLTRLASVIVKQEMLEDEHAEWLEKQDNAAAKREQHKRRTRG